MKFSSEEQAWVVNEWTLGRTQKDIAQMVEHHASYICSAIAMFCYEQAGCGIGGIYEEERKKIARAGLIKFIAEGGQIKQPRSGFKDPNYYGPAREEHAWLLRAEGLKLRQISERLGVSKDRVRMMIFKFGRRASRATRRTRWHTQATDRSVRL